MTADELKKEYYREYQREWRKNNREKIKAYHKNWRAKNKDKIKKYTDSYWQRKAEDMELKSNLTTEEQILLLKDKKSIRDIAKELNVSKSKVHRIIKAKRI